MIRFEFSSAFGTADYGISVTRSFLFSQQNGSGQRRDIRTMGRNMGIKRREAGPHTSSVEWVRFSVPTS